MANFTKKIKQIESLLPQALGRDRLAAQHEIQRLRQAQPKSLSGQKIGLRLKRLENRLNASIQKKSLRKQKLPALRYNFDLPIIAKKDDIIRAISKHPVIIVSGETGSGKTTQIPKFCLAAGRGIDGVIGHTQPRRIAATTVAFRIAEELGQKLGRAVGYKIRFHDRTPKDAYIKLMTDGILLAETQTDRYLSTYDTIIVDEAHERSLNIDFILGILQTLLARRDDLKLIITSATIDTEKFSKAFNDAPVIEVSGRMFPVEVHYQSQEATQKDNGELTHVELAVQAVKQLQTETSSGDILVFMPTEQDIRDTCELIAADTPEGPCILPLFARLTAAEQSRVFKPIAERKIIVATNVAETSITIPGIKYVVDSGLARISRYSPRSRTTSLPVRPVSRSSADQRMGRCGRVENGVCIRLFAEADYDSRSRFTPPEIRRANLAEVILRMIALKLGDISDFPFIDRPDAKSIKDGFDLLLELGAIQKVQKKEARGQKAEGVGKRAKRKGQSVFQDSADPQNAVTGSFKYVTLTEKGRLMAKIPLDPRLSRMLIEAKSQGCMDEIAVIVSVLSIQDPRERPAEKAQEADRMHAAFEDPNSDFVTLLNIWHGYHYTWKKFKTHNQMKHYCRQNYLSYKRMREWRDIYNQIVSILEEHGMLNAEWGMRNGEGGRRKGEEAIRDAEFGMWNEKGIKGTGKEGKRNTEKQISQISDAKFEKIHKSILSGFLSNIAEKKEKNTFRAAKGREVMIFPGSGLFDRAANWIVAAEIVETSRVFARTVANIKSDWLEDLGGALCRRTYLDPHWERNRGEVMASEQVSLFGLIIVAERKVSYGKINPHEACDIFIRSALMDGDLKKPFAFMQHNHRLVDRIKTIEDRIRRRDILISEAQIFTFYKERLDGIYNLQALSSYLKTRGDDNFLRMNQADLFAYHPDEVELSLYPERIELGGRPFEVSYRFEPGKDDDGVTVNVPSTLVSEVPSEAIDWLIPGLYKEKIAALIKSLPKAYRRKLVPVNATVDVIAGEMQHAEGSLIASLGKFIYERFGVDIPASAWPVQMLPDHLKMRIAITAADGRQICAGRDPAILRYHTEKKVNLAGFESARQKWERTGITRWDFGDLPDFISNTGPDNVHWVAYPALEKAKGSDKNVNLRLYRRREEALAAHKQGVAALFSIYFSKDIKFLKKRLALPKKIIPMADYFGGAKRFEKMMFERVIQTLFSMDIRSETEFHAYAERIAPKIIAGGQQIIENALPILTAYHETRSLINKLQQAGPGNATVAQFFDALIEDLTQLVPETFIELYEPEQLADIERYIKTVGIRAQRASIDFEKDQAKGKEVRPFVDSLNQLLSALSPNVSEEKRKAVEEYFWMVEEYKVSVFAQELKTAFPISKKRLVDKLKQIQRMV